MADGHPHSLGSVLSLDLGVHPGQDRPDTFGHFGERLGGIGRARRETRRGRVILDGTPQGLADEFAQCTTGPRAVVALPQIVAELRRDSRDGFGHRLLTTLQRAGQDPRDRPPTQGFPDLSRLIAALLGEAHGR